MVSFGPHNLTSNKQDMQNDKRGKIEKICIKNMQNDPGTQRFLIITYCSSLLKCKKGKGHKNVLQKSI